MTEIAHRGNNNFQLFLACKKINCLIYYFCDVEQVTSLQLVLCLTVLALFTEMFLNFHAILCMCICEFDILNNKSFV